MSEIGLVEIFGMAEAIALIGTLFVILYFSRKQMQSLSLDIETKVLNDLNERMHAITTVGIERPDLVKVLNKANISPEFEFAYNILFTFAHVFHMRQRKVLRDYEWTGWVRGIKSTFERGTIMDIWKSNVSMEWFDPAFREFINTEIVPVSIKKQ